MDAGLLLTSVHDRTVPPSQQIAEHRELIAAASEAGFELIVAGQHFAAPALRYLQPIPYLASLAEAAGTMRLATGILLLPLLHPLQVAEELATLDAITGGRAVMGLGIGYSQKEYDAFGLDRALRTDRFEESIGLIRRLWSGESVTYEGTHFRFDEVAASAVPVQPQIPIWIGAQEAPSVRRAGRLADAWYVPPFPTHAKLVDLYRLYVEERERRGAGGSPAIPVRRELYLADTVAEAQAAVSAGAASRYATYSSWGLDVESALDQHRWRESRFLLGDPATVAEKLLELAEDVAFSHFVYKPQWPGQAHTVSMAQMERFATELLPLLQ